MKRNVTYGIILIGFSLTTCNPFNQKIDITSKDFGYIKSTLEKGLWVWQDSSCANNYKTFEFDLPKKQLVLAIHDTSDVENDFRQDYTYDIFWGWKNGFRGKVVDEQRLTEDGLPVVWDLFLVSDSVYYWHRTDWPPFSGTASNVMCP